MNFKYFYCNSATPIPLSNVIFATVIPQSRSNFNSGTMSNNNRFWSRESKHKSSTVETYPILVEKVEPQVEQSKNFKFLSRKSKHRPISVKT